jgi:hypothetical protein
MYLCQMFVDQYPTFRLTEYLFNNMLNKARIQAGIGHQPGQVQALLEYLQQHGPGGYSNAHVDVDNRCDRIFYMSEEMISTFRRNGQFVLMDATCKTNRFGMMLVLLVGVNQIMRTEIMAISLIVAEDIESYTWILEQAKQAIGQHSIPIHVWFASAP